MSQPDTANSSISGDSVEGDRPTSKQLRAGLVSALASVYGDVLRRQGRTTTQFVRWSKVTKRAHEFAWLGGVESRETLMHGNGPLQVRPNSELFDAVRKMHATVSLNPYERDYGLASSLCVGSGHVATAGCRYPAWTGRFAVRCRCCSHAA